MPANVGILEVLAEMRHFQPALSSEPVRRRAMQTDYVFVLSEPGRVFACLFHCKTLLACLFGFFDLHWCMCVLGVLAEMRHFQPALSSEPVRRRAMQTDYVFVLSEPGRVFACLFPCKTLLACLFGFFICIGACAFLECRLR